MGNSFKGWLLIICIFTCFTTNAYAHEPKLHVFTYANKRHIGLSYLDQSCKALGVDLKILGIGSANYQGNKLPFPNLLEKIRVLEEHLQKSTLADDDVILFVDAFDVIFLKGEEEILKRFLKMNVPLLMGAERNCVPWKHVEGQYPASPTSFRFVNSGVFIGYVKPVKEILKWVLDHPEKTNKAKNDQGSFTMYYLENPGEILLDHYNALVLNAFMVRMNELVVDKSNRTLFVEETEADPCILHGNGFAMAYRKIRKMFYGKLKA